MFITTAQIDLLLAALSALLPLVPDKHRVRASDIIDAAGDVAGAVVSIGGAAGDLATKLAALRDEIETMSGRELTAADMDAALARVRKASAAFRAAMENAAVGST